MRTVPECQVRASLTTPAVMENQFRVFSRDTAEKKSEGILYQVGPFGHNWSVRDIYPIRQLVSFNRGGTFLPAAPSVAPRMLNLARCSASQLYHVLDVVRLQHR
jgi:hypothetical protein